MTTERKPKSIIRRRGARDLFQLLVRELEEADTLSDRVMLIVDNMVLLEEMKLKHIDDIKKRGVVELFKNGSQEMWRQNKSVDAVLKIVEQQRKLQAELKLTPASDKRVAKVLDVDEDEFDDF